MCMVIIDAEGILEHQTVRFRKAMVNFFLGSWVVFEKVRDEFLIIWQCAQKDHWSNVNCNARVRYLFEIGKCLYG